MEGGERDAAVLQRADVRRLVELLLDAGLDRIDDGGVDALLHGGQNDVLVLGSRFVPIGVDADDERLAVGLGGGGRPQADWAGDGHDDVRALLDELVGHGGPLRLIVEGVRELALLGLLVPSEDLHVLLMVLVVAGHAVGESVHEDRDGRELDSAEGSDLAGLGVGRGRVSGEVGRLVRVEDEGAGVLGLVLEGRVDDGELFVRVGLRGVFDRFGQLEPDADRQIAFGFDHRLHVGGEIVVGFRLCGVGPHAEVVNGLVQTFLGRLVERLVVPPPGVGDDAGSIVDLLCRGALRRVFLRRGALSRLAAAAGAERQCRNAEKRGNFAVLHACFSWLCASASEKDAENVT